ncbi:MAG: glycosyltransferase family 4 protein [Deltaproteobacteria bacterium]|nr:glycosyltransferase family 4 protein [Deltaproteobacteria bacterium]
MQLETQAKYPCKSRLRICLLGYRSDPHCGGQGVYLKNLSRALAQIGHDVTVVSGPPYPHLDTNIRLVRLPSLDLYNPAHLFRVGNPLRLLNPANFVEWFGITSMGFSEPLAFGMRAYHYLRKRFDDFDIVHDNQSLSYWLLALNRYLPTTATIHHPITIDRDIAVRSARSVVKKVMEWRWYAFVGMQKRVSAMLSHILTVSECARGDIVRDFKIPAGRFRIVPNGIDTALFYPLSGIERNPGRIMVTNSADVPLKGLAYLLRSVADLSKTRDVKLVVIGAPRKNGQVGKLIRQLGIAHLITFTGRIDHDEFVRQYARANMAVIPSLYEGFGLPAGEAMACGVPVISTTAGALPEVVGDTGLLVPPANHNRLTKAIETLLDNPEKATEMGQAGYRRIHRQFTWKRAAEKTVNAYREVIRDHRGLQAA